MSQQSTQMFLDTQKSDRKPTLEEYTACLFGAPFSNETLNSIGMSENPGIL